MQKNIMQNYLHFTEKYFDFFFIELHISKNEFFEMHFIII